MAKEEKTSFTETKVISNCLITRLKNDIALFTEVVKTVKNHTFLGLKEKTEKNK